MPLGAIINSAIGGIIYPPPLGGRVNFVLGILLVLPSLMGGGQQGVEGDL